MYAIIRAGGKQAKVHSGDVIEIERVKGDPSELTFSPLLVVDDKGNAVSDRSVLAKASVVAKVLGESAGPKIDIYKYKNKTGYSRRQGHRQKYTQIEITGIELPGASKAKPAAKTAAPEEPEAGSKEQAETTEPAKTSTKAKAGAAKTTTAKKPAAAKPASSKASSAKAPAKTQAAKSSAKKPASKTAKTDKPEEK